VDFERRPVESSVATLAVRRPCGQLYQSASGGIRTGLCESELLDRYLMQPSHPARIRTALIRDGADEGWLSKSDECGGQE